MTNQAQKALSVQHCYFKAHSTFSQLHATWDAYTEVSFHSLHKKPKTKPHCSHFKKDRPVQIISSNEVKRIGQSSQSVFSCSLPANPSWQMFIGDTDADDSVHCRWTDEP